MENGPGLAFVAIAEAVANMHISPLWAVLFYSVCVFHNVSTGPTHCDQRWCIYDQPDRWVGSLHSPLGRCSRRDSGNNVVLWDPQIHKRGVRSDRIPYRLVLADLLVGNLSRLFGGHSMSLNLQPTAEPELRAVHWSQMFPYHQSTSTYTIDPRKSTNTR
eukprot:sb/3472907/